jgi:hypothetical protein
MLGFTLTEVAMILRGLGEPNVTEHWRALAARKIAELDRTVATARAIKRLLEEGLRCGCVDASVCLPKLKEQWLPELKEQWTSGELRGTKPRRRRPARTVARPHPRSGK